MNPSLMIRLEAYTLSNRGRSLRIADSQSAGWKPVPKHINYSVGYWLPASCEGLIANRRQMLAHFPTVTQSTGFQPEPLLTAHPSLLTPHYSSLTTLCTTIHTLLLLLILIRYYYALFSFHLRYVFAFHSMTKRSSIEDKAKFYRTSIEDLSNIYRRPIEDLSNRACGNFLMPLFLQSLSVALIY